MRIDIYKLNNEINTDYENINVNNIVRTHKSESTNLDINTLLDSDSIAMGVNTEASGDFSTAMGRYTEASGNYSTAMGLNTVASGYTSTTMGGYTVASGYYSTAMGYNTVASGKTSTVMGYNAEASGQYSTAMGYLTVASGNTSTAMGRYTEASGNYSTAMGLNTVAGGQCEFSIGYYNTIYIPNNDGNDRLFNVGNGSSNVLSDAFTVYNNGTIKIKSFLFSELPSIKMEGQICYISDANNISYRGLASGGGTEKALVFFDGSNWIYH